MICCNCKLTPICKVFAMINNVSSAIRITIDDCNIFLSNTPTIKSQHDSTSSTLTVRTSEDLLTVSSRIKELTNVQKDCISQVANDTVNEKSLIKCADCGQTIYKTNSIKCFTCDKNFCDNCVTYSINTSPSNPYCKKCWDTAPGIVFSAT